MIFKICGAIRTANRKQLVLKLRCQSIFFKFNIIFDMITLILFHVLDVYVFLINSNTCVIELLKYISIKVCNFTLEEACIELSFTFNFNLY